MDHSRALGHAADAHPPAAQVGLQGDLLVNQVGGKDRPGGAVAPLGTEGGHQGVQPRQQDVHGNWHADHPGGADQHLFGGQAQPLS